ncbi:MAG: hypothetical protein VX061_07610 [Pseudomonadota bacterium]|nr:hypothetical protein [Pseudomonadota bacterium]
MKTVDAGFYVYVPFVESARLGGALSLVQVIQVLEFNEDGSGVIWLTGVSCDYSPREILASGILTRRVDVPTCARNRDGSVARDTAGL